MFELRSSTPASKSPAVSSGNICPFSGSGRPLSEISTIGRELAATRQLHDTQIQALASHFSHSDRIPIPCMRTRTAGNTYEPRSTISACGHGTLFSRPQNLAHSCYRAFRRGHELPGMWTLLARIHTGVSCLKRQRPIHSSHPPMFEVSIARPPAAGARQDRGILHGRWVRRAARGRPCPLRWPFGDGRGVSFGSRFSSRPRMRTRDKRSSTACGSCAGRRTSV